MARDDEPTLTDGTVVVRPWDESDGDDARPVEDHGLVIDVDGAVAGEVALTLLDDETGALAYHLRPGHRGYGSATRAVRMLTDWALTAEREGGRGLTRVQALVETSNERAMRVATRAGLRREGVQRMTPRAGRTPGADGYVVLARLATDPPLTEPGAFRALLNSFLPRKRAIAQVLVRDGGSVGPGDEPRVLLCQLTYKQDWDLPGGVVEVGESPQLAAVREVQEELGLTIPPGPLLLTDWLPPWGGWDDALCLVFDGGAPVGIDTRALTLQAREIRSAEFCTLEQAGERCTEFTAARIASALANLPAGGSGGGPAYVERGGLGT